MTSIKPNLVIADTSCLIILNNAGILYLLKSLYQSITITPEIADEFGQELPSWFVIQKPNDSKLNVLLNSLIDKGEASAITLALELDKDVLLILDDYKAR